MAYKFKTAVLGGTFDHFHKGHKRLLEFGLSVSERLFIGVTSDKFVKEFKIQNSKFKNKYQNLQFENYSTRKKILRNFLETNAKGRFSILKIENMFGPTLDKDFAADAILVSKDTKEGAFKINEERERKGFEKLDIEITPDVLSEDGIPVSSFRIRNGEIDRDGNLYTNLLWFHSDLEITDEIREELKRPLGKLLKKVDVSSFKDFEGALITVGDETSKVLNSLGLKARISVIDFKIAREKRFSDIIELGFLGKEKIYRVLNPPGTITRELFEAAKKVFESEERQIVLIDGEDDLSVLPIILTSPLENYVFYGQPGEGMVKILITEEIKAKIRQIVAGFKTLGH